MNNWGRLFLSISVRAINVLDVPKSMAYLNLVVERALLCHLGIISAFCPNRFSSIASKAVSNNS